MAHITQSELVYGYLATGKALTVKKAQRKFGIPHVGTVVHQLRQQGFNIVSESKASTGVGAPKVKYYLDRGVRRRKAG